MTKNTVRTVRFVRTLWTMGESSTGECLPRIRIAEGSMGNPIDGEYKTGYVWVRLGNGIVVHVFQAHLENV